MLIKIKCQCRKITWNGLCYCEQPHTNRIDFQITFISESNSHFDDFSDGICDAFHANLCECAYFAVIFQSQRENDFIPYSIPMVFRSPHGHFYCFHFHWKSIENENPFKFHQTRNEFFIKPFFNLPLKSSIFALVSFRPLFEYACELNSRRAQAKSSLKALFSPGVSLAYY